MQKQQVARDELDYRIVEEFTAEMQKLERRPATIESLKAALFGTFAPLIQDLLQQVNARVVQTMQVQDSHSEALTEALESVDALMADAMRVMPGDIPAVAVCARSMKDLGEALLSGKTPNMSDPQVREAVGQAVAAAERVIAIVDEYESEEEGDEEDEEGEEGGGDDGEEGDEDDEELAASEADA